MYGIKRGRYNYCNKHTQICKKPWNRKKMCGVAKIDTAVVLQQGKIQSFCTLKVWFL